MGDIITLITNQGFAIGMCAYVMVVVNKNLQELTKAVTVLSANMEKGGTQ